MKSIPLKSFDSRIFCLCTKLNLKVHSAIAAKLCLVRNNRYHNCGYQLSSLAQAVFIRLCVCSHTTGCMVHLLILLLHFSQDNELWRIFNNCYSKKRQKRECWQDIVFHVKLVSLCNIYSHENAFVSFLTGQLHIVELSNLVQHI